MNTLSVQSSGEPNLISEGDEMKTTEVAERLPETDALAAAVAALPAGEYVMDEHTTLSIHHDRASSIGPAYVDFHLRGKERKIIFSVGCPESGPKLARIVLWQNDEPNIALQTDFVGWEPKNNGITQMHVDELTAFVQSLSHVGNKTLASAEALKISHGIQLLLGHAASSDK